MRAWQLLACIALAQLAVSAAFSFSSHGHETFSGDLEAAASGHGGGHGGGGGGHGHSSGFEEAGGMDFGEEHHSKVSDLNWKSLTIDFSTDLQNK